MASGTPRGYRGVVGHQELLEGIGVSGVHWGAGRECRYSGEQGYRCHWGILVGVGCQGASGTVRGVGPSGSVGVSGVHCGAGRECR